MLHFLQAISSLLMVTLMNNISVCNNPTMEIVWYVEMKGKEKNLFFSLGYCLFSIEIFILL